MAKVNKDSVRVLKKFAKNPVGYVSKKASCMKEAKKRGLSVEEARNFCKFGSKSSKRRKAAGKVKAVPNQKIRK